MPSQDPSSTEECSITFIHPPPSETFTGPLYRIGNRSVQSSKFLRLEVSTDKNQLKWTESIILYRIVSVTLRAWI